MTIKIGDRVGALQSMDAKTVHLYGYGVYQGEQDAQVHEMLGVTRAELEAHVEELRASNSLSPDFAYTAKNPQILLDDGRIVWGYQCWWGSEAGIREKIGDREVIHVP